MAARHDPGFIRYPRSIRTERHVVSANFDDAQVLPLLLRQNVAEHTALLALVIVASSPEFIQHAPWHKRGRGQLRSRMVEFLSRSLAVILENADVLKAAVTFQILNPQRSQPQKLLHLEVAGVPEMAVVPRIFQQNFV